MRAALNPFLLSKDDPPDSKIVTVAFPFYFSFCWTNNLFVISSTLICSGVLLGWKSSMLEGLWVSSPQPVYVVFVATNISGS